MEGEGIDPSDSNKLMEAEDPRCFGFRRRERRGLAIKGPAESLLAIQDIHMRSYHKVAQQTATATHNLSFHNT